MLFTSSRRKQGRKVLSDRKKRRCITVNSHFKNNVTNKYNTSNSDDVKVNPNLPRINVFA